MCRMIMAGVRKLRENRDMSINEIKLTVAIEDPVDRERRQYLDIEVRQEITFLCTLRLLSDVRRLSPVL